MLSADSSVEAAEEEGAALGHRGSHSAAVPTSTSRALQGRANLCLSTWLRQLCKKAEEPVFFLETVDEIQAGSFLVPPWGKLRFESLVLTVCLSRACQMTRPWLAEARDSICCFSHFLHSYLKLNFPGTKTGHEASVTSFGGKYCEVFLKREQQQDGSRKGSTGAGLFPAPPLHSQKIFSERVTELSYMSLFSLSLKTSLKTPSPHFDALHNCTSFAQEKRPWLEICRLCEAAMGLLQCTLGLPRITPQKWITRRLSALVTQPLHPHQAVYAQNTESCCESSWCMKCICLQFLLPHTGPG